MKRRSAGINRRAFLAGAGATGAWALLGLPGCGGGGYDYAPLVALWRRRHALEAEHLEALRFTLSPNQISAGKVLKLVLRDQQGGDWLFKVGGVASCGARAIYELCTLFGWEIPELQRASVIVNGKEVRGTLQRYIPDARNLVGFVKEARRGNDRLTPRAWSDLLQSQLFGWITANHHLHILQFIATIKWGEVTRVQRIDNAVEWYLVGHDRLDESFMTPILASRVKHSLLGYRWMWDLFQNGHAPLPLAEVYGLARFIAAAPDELYAERFREGIENEFDCFGNNSKAVLRGLVPDLVESFDESSFLPTMMARKNTLPTDIAALFETQLEKAGRRVAFFDGPSHRETGERIIRGLEARIAELEARLVQLGGHQPPRRSIEAVTSVEAYGIIRQVLESANIPKSRVEQKVVFSDAIVALTELLPHADNPFERQGIGHAITHLEGLIENPLSEAEARAQVCCFNSIFPVLPDAS